MSSWIADLLFLYPKGNFIGQKVAHAQTNYEQFKEHTRAGNALDVFVLAATDFVSRDYSELREETLIVSMDDVMKEMMRAACSEWDAFISMGATNIANTILTMGHNALHHGVSENLKEVIASSRVLGAKHVEFHESQVSQGMGKERAAFDVVSFFNQQTDDIFAGDYMQGRKVDEHISDDTLEVIKQQAFTLNELSLQLVRNVHYDYIRESETRYDDTIKAFQPRTYDSALKRDLII